MKIFCIEYNTNYQPEKPIVYMLPGTSILNSNKPFYIPEFSSEISCQIGLVFRICKVGKYIQPQFASNYIDAVALGIQFTAKDLFDKSIELNEPKDLSRSFDGSFPLSEYVAIDEQFNFETLNFDLQLNNVSIQNGFYAKMNYSIQELITYLSQFFIMKLGDLIFISGGSMSQSLKVSDLVTAMLNDKKMLTCKIK